MQPIFKIVANSQDITDTIRKRLISLAVSLEAKDRLDTTTLILDNSPPYIEPPRTGVQLSIQIGYKGIPFDEPLTFIVDEIQYFGPPYSLTIRARSANLISPIRSHKERLFENTTFKKILADIAAEHNLEIVIEDGIADFKVEYYAQMHSDFATIGALALEHLGVDVQTEIIQNKIIIAKRGIKKTIKSKVNINALEIPQTKIIRYRTIMAERSKYSRVIAKWYDAENGEAKSETAGSGSPSLIINRLFADATEAQRAATAQLRALNQGAATLRATIIGHPALFAQMPIHLNGLPPGASGIWNTSSVIHKIDSSGFTSEIVATSDE